MKSKWLLMLAAFALVFGAFAIAGCSADGEDETGTDGTVEVEKYVVATDAPFAPFDMVNEETGEIYGFDMDIMNAIAKDQGFEVEYKVYAFDGLLAGLSTGTTDFDFATSAISITPERAETILFSDPYYTATQSLSVPADSAVKGIADLKAGMSIAVQTGTTGHLWAQENLESKGIVLKTYPQGIDCFNAMLAGDVDAIFLDTTPSQDIAADATMKAKLVEAVNTDEDYGFGFPKDATDIHAKVNAGLANIIASGEYDEIYNKYFPNDSSGSIVNK